MKPIRRGGGNQYPHRESEAYRKAIRRKLRTYHVFLFIGVVTQGLMHYLSACHTESVWRQCSRSWLSTIRQGVVPTEKVVKIALRNELLEFLLVGAENNPIAKFIVEHQPLTVAIIKMKRLEKTRHSRVIMSTTAMI